jgi:hypothetical protein
MFAARQSWHTIGAQDSNGLTRWAEVVGKGQGNFIGNFWAAEIDDANPLTPF